MNRRAPRPLATALARVTADIAPRTGLARVQAVWDDVVGREIAAHCAPAGERAGVLQVSCDESVWAAEVELMAAEILARLALATGAPAMTALRCRADAAPGPGFP